MICFSHDHLGHGMSEGERATIPDVEWYVDDVIQHVLRVNFIISDIHISIPFKSSHSFEDISRGNYFYDNNFLSSNVNIATRRSSFSAIQWVDWLL